MGAPRLSVCVVAQNHASFLGRLFANVDEVAWEIVLIDGGSKDGTDELAAANPKVRHFRVPWQGSVTRQKNIAMDRARGEWILILDCDELLGPDLRAALPGLMRNPLVRYYKFPRYNLVQVRPHRHVVAKHTYPNFQFRMLRRSTRLRYDERLPVHNLFEDPRRPGRRFKGVRKKLFMRKPRDLHIFHYDFYLNDRAARERKVARYESLQPGGGLESDYLWEDQEHRIVDTPPPWPEEDHRRPE